MVCDNPTWDAPRVHGELKMLGFDISERTVLRWMRKAPRSPEPAKHWAVFLKNHREAIAAMDFFTVSTLNFGILYCFFVIGHDRRVHHAAPLLGQMEAISAQHQLRWEELIRAYAGALIEGLLFSRGVEPHAI